MLKSWLLITVVTMCVASDGLAQTATRPASPAAPSSTTKTGPPKPITMLVRGADDRVTGMGRRIRVEIDSLRQAVEQDSLDARKFVLYLDGHALWNVRSEPVDMEKNKLEFLLERADTSRAAWVALLGSPAHRTKSVRVGIGYDSRHELGTVNPARPPTVSFVVLGGWRLFWGFAVIGVLLVMFVILAFKSTIIRDSGPPKPENNGMRPFSLARFQMAVWFFLILTAFVFLWIITGSVDTLNAQALILIGIGTGTALGAAAVDSSKRESAEDTLRKVEPQLAAAQAEVQKLQAQLGQLAAQNPPDPAAQIPVATRLAQRQADIDELTKQQQDAKASETKPVSEGLRKDLLTDASGVSFHRFQILAWTIVLASVFINGVYQRLAMPEFNVTLLALMGISAGTYLGFKIPEKQG